MTITAKPRPPITQEALQTYLIIEATVAETRQRLIHLIGTGSRIEPGPLGINAIALIEPRPPLVIPRDVADVLERASYEAGTLRVSSGKQARS